MFWLLTTILVSVVITAFLQRHYVFACFLATVAAYELPFHFFVQYPQYMDNIADGSSLYFIKSNIFSNDLSGSSLIHVRLVLLTFVLITSLTYFIMGRYKISFFRHVSIVQEQAEIPFKFLTFVPFLLIMFSYGLLSSFAGAGQIRIMEYSKEIADSGGGIGMASLFYGQTLLVCMAALLIYFLGGGSAKSQKFEIIFIGFCGFLLVTQIFFSAKRQFFAPSALLVILFILYSPRVTYKWLWILLMPVAIGVLFSVQMVMRNIIAAGNTVEVARIFSDGDISQSTIFTELVAIAATTYRAITTIRLEDATYGMHIIFQGLAAVPGLHVGSILTAFFGKSIWYNYDDISPFGGLSMIADAWITMNWIGVIVFSIIMGLFLNLTHNYLLRTYIKNYIPSFQNIYWLGLLGTFLTMYRHGIANCVSFFVSYSILFIICVLIPGKVLRRINYR